MHNDMKEKAEKDGMVMVPLEEEQVMERESGREDILAMKEAMYE